MGMICKWSWIETSLPTYPVNPLPVPCTASLAFLLIDAPLINDTSTCPETEQRLWWMDGWRSIRRNGCKAVVALHWLQVQGSTLGDRGCCRLNCVPAIMIDKEHATEICGRRKETNCNFVCAKLYQFRYMGEVPQHYN